MYYNEIRQPDGTHCIGINYDEERPSVLEVLPNPELEIQQRRRQPDYQLLTKNCTLVKFVYYFS